jgi:hypothetical protein
MTTLDICGAAKLLPVIGPPLNEVRALSVVQVVALIDAGFVIILRRGSIPETETGDKNGTPSSP